MSTQLDRKKVVLGMSGGVDSTVAALKLKEQGYEVTGLYFNVLTPGIIKTKSYPKGYDNEVHEVIIDNDSKIKAGLDAAKSVADQLGIEFVYKDLHEDFNACVVNNFCSEYACGHTPNPCVVCNPNIKFKVLIDFANEIGAYHIATGHYADTFYNEATDTWHIAKAINEKKDQSYMLHRLDQETISRLLLPLNGIEDKSQVREQAKEAALKNAEAKDSQEICFIDDSDDYRVFLHRNGINPPEGDFIDSEGNIVGKHKGILNYTMGQRKGLGVTLGKPAFVTEINAENNTVTLGDNADLFKQIVEATDLVIAKDIPASGLTAKTRYKHNAASIEILEIGENKLKARFMEPQRAITPGQSLVIYHDNIVIGGGFIK